MKINKKGDIFQSERNKPTTQNIKKIEKYSYHFVTTPIKKWNKSIIKINRNKQKKDIKNLNNKFN